MYFQLLVGLWQDEHGHTHRAVRVRDKNGQVTQEDLPIVESSHDLVASFGPKNFRRLSNEEITLLLPDKDQAPANPALTAASAGASGKTPVQEAAEKGASQPQRGDVTEQFPKAQRAGLRVYRQADGKYFVSEAETNDLLSDQLVSRIAVHGFVKQFLEKHQVRV